jgi:hypothetical protein
MSSYRTEVEQMQVVSCKIRRAPTYTAREWLPITDLGTRQHSSASTKIQLDDRYWSPLKLPVLMTKRLRARTLMVQVRLAKVQDSTFSECCQCLVRQFAVTV